MKLTDIEIVERAKKDAAYSFLYSLRELHPKGSKEYKDYNKLCVIRIGQIAELFLT
jgi:hypothetical protein